MLETTIKKNPFKETLASREELFADFAKFATRKKELGQNALLAYYGLCHGEAIIKFCEGKVDDLMKHAGIPKTSIAYFQAGLNAWKNLYEGLTVLPESSIYSLHHKNKISDEFKNFSLQQIFYGAPGTGKSHEIKEEEKFLDKDNVFRTTFHPDSDYASFVGTYKPTVKEGDSEVVPVVIAKGNTFELNRAIKETKIVYEFVPQVFSKAYVKAWNIWQNATSKTTVSKATFGDITVKINGLEICKDAPMATAGLELLKKFIEKRGSASLEEIVDEWNKISPKKPDLYLLNPKTTTVKLKEDRWPLIEIGGIQYRFVKEMHADCWEKFCDDVKKLFEKYGDVVEITSVPKLRKKKDDNEVDQQKVLLVIEEINRGNCAQIFGDIFQLLDRGDDAFSEYPIVPDKDIKDFLNKEFESVRRIYTDDIKNEINRHFDNKDVATAILNGEVLVLPPNLYIWATMNTSDQSLFPMDSAFKRRWEWKYIPISYKNEDWVIKIGEKKYKWVDFQRKINDKIYSIDNSEDKQLGDFFVDANRTGKVISADTLLNKILFYIWNDVCKDDPDQIFRWIDYKDKEEKSIRFSDFFTDDKDKKIQGLMSFLGIKAEGAAEEEEKPEISASSGEPDMVVIPEIAAGE